MVTMLDKVITENEDRYFLQDSISGEFIQGLWKLQPDGRIYFWSAHDKWEYAIKRNEQKDKLEGLTETTKENVYRYINKKTDEN